MRPPTCLLKVPTVTLGLLLSFFAASDLAAQGSPAESGPGEAALLASLASVPLVAHAALWRLENQTEQPAFALQRNRSEAAEALLLLMPLPLFRYDAPKATAFLAGAGAVYSSAVAVQAFDGPFLLSNTLFTLSQKLNMESAYEVYRDRRLRSSDSVYRDFSSASFSEIALAPFSDAALHPLSLVVVPLYALGAAVGEWPTAATRSVFATGRTYFRGTEYSPWVATPLVLAAHAVIAVQNSFEEAYWRGFVYEELKFGFRSSMGSLSWLPASVLGSALFAIWHLEAQEFSWNLAGVFALGLVLDWSYESGGLRAAGAGHGLANALAGLAVWALTAGVPQPEPVRFQPRPVTMSFRDDRLVLSVSLTDWLGWGL